MIYCYQVLKVFIIYSLCILYVDMFMQSVFVNDNHNEYFHSLIKDVSFQMEFYIYFG